MSDPVINCPFCGGKAEHIKVCSARTSAYRFAVICTNCSATSKHCLSEADAADKWNSRAKGPLLNGSGLSIGDKVEVLDEGLAMLRRMCPDHPPNNIGIVSAFLPSGLVEIEFPVSGENHTQSAPYQIGQIKKYATTSQ